MKGRHKESEIEQDFPKLSLVEVYEKSQTLRVCTMESRKQ